MYELINLNKSFENKQILSNINLKFPQTGFVIITGENGSGKSTLLNLIGALDKPTTGVIRFNQSELSNLNEEELIVYREKYISFIFQNSNLFENSTVFENITIMNQSQKFASIVNAFRLQNLLNVKVKKLSGGEKKRVAIARALMKDAKVILADEPTSSLDAETKKMLFQYLKTVSENRLVIMVSHDLDLSNIYADQIIQLNNGKIINILNKNINNKDNIISPCKNNFHLIKFVFGNLFLNKKRLITSLILLIFSFIFLLLSTSLASLDFVSMHTDTLALEKDDLIIFKKNGKYNEKYQPVSEFSESDINYLNQHKFSNNKLKIGKTMNVDGGPINFSIKYDIKSKKPYYQHFITNKLSFLNIDELEKIDFGKKPTKNNEIVISSYLADQMIHFGVMNENKEYYLPKDYKSLITDEELLILGTNSVKVVGIYDSKFDEYKILKEHYEKLPKNIENINSIFSEKVTHLAGNIYVNEEFFDIYSNIRTTVNSDLIFKIREQHVVNKSDYLSTSPIVFDNHIGVFLMGDILLTHLNKNEIIVNNEILQELGLDATNCIGKSMNIWVDNSFTTSTKEILNLTIKGVSADNDYYMSEETLHNLTDKKVYINKVYLLENNKNIINQILSSFPLQNGEYTIETNYSFSIEGLTGFVSIVSKIFFILTPVFLILSFFILITYILNSIEIHTKDIAILKAFGIKPNKISLLFLTETLILLISSYIFSLVLFLIIRIILNNIATNLLLFSANIIPIQIFYILFILIVILIFVFIIFYLIQIRTKKLVPQLIFKTN